MKRLSFGRISEEVDVQGVLMKVLNGMAKEWLDFGILRLIDRMDVDPTLTFVAVARLCEVDRLAPVLYD